MRLFSLFVSLLLLSLASAFLLEIGPASSPKCFLSTLLPHQDLLLEIQLPIIQDPVQFQLEAKDSQGRLFFSKLIQKSKDRIRVSVDNNALPASMGTVEVCISCTAGDEFVGRNSYLIWFAQLNNFSHESQQREDTNVDPLQLRFTQMKQKISKLKEVYSEQLRLFSLQQEMETENEEKLERTLQDACFTSILESAAIVTMSVTYVCVLRKFI